MNIYQYGKKIKELRNQNSLTQQQLADMVGVSAKTVSHWETGYTMPDVEMMMKLSEIFNVSLNDLVNEKSTIPPQKVVEEYTEQYTKSKGRFSRLNWYQKAVLIFVIAMSVVFTVAYVVVSSKEGFLYKNSIFTPTEVRGKKIYSGKIGGNQAVFTIKDNTLVFKCGDETYGPYIFREDPTAIPEKDGLPEHMTGLEITKDDKVIFHGGIVELGDGEYYLFGKDGNTDYNVSIISSTDTITLEPSPSVLVNLMYGSKITHKGELVPWFSGLMFCIITAISILFENEIFHWELSFRISDPERAEPSDWEIMGRYVSWTIIPVLALQMFILSIK